MEMVTMGPHDASDAFVFELETFLKKKRKRVTKNILPFNSGPPGCIF